MEGVKRFICFLFGHEPYLEVKADQRKTVATDSDDCSRCGQYILGRRK